MSRKLWLAVLALGVVMVPIGAVWMAYAIAQTDTTTTATSGSDSVWPIVAFFVAFIGGTLITVGSLGFMLRWMSGDGDDEMLGTSPSETLAHAVPKTRVWWGGDPPGSQVTPPRRRLRRPATAFTREDRVTAVWREASCRPR